MKTFIGELLVAQGVISRHQLEEALRLQKHGKRLLGQILLGMGWASEAEMYQALANLLHVKFVSFDQVQIDPQIVQLVPELLAVTRDILPLSVQDNDLYLVMENPRDIDVIRIVEFTTDRQVKPVIAPLSQLRAMIREQYHIKIGERHPDNRPTDLSHLGLSQEHLEQYRQMIQRPQGLIFVTGPTGSGKTTTLYASLHAIKGEATRNIVTIEDPIETQLEGIKQIQINEKAGLTFTNVLSLVHDQYSSGHTVILVGEFQDQHTAEIAVRISETGHLILSSLHTRDVVSALYHLFHLGLAPELLASELIGVLTQRLVRKLCSACKKPYTPDEQELRSIGIPADQHSSFVGYKRVGCENCRGTGYQGQVGIYETFAPNAQLRAEIVKRPAKHTLRKLAVEAGMKTLLDDGIAKIRAGLTTIGELARVCCTECPGCGKAIPDTETTCPFCQNQLYEMCEQCGAKLEIEWLLCPFCGTRKLSGSEATA